MADPIFNLKTGADSDIFFARVVTTKGTDLGKIKTKDGIYTYPMLTRSTGNSIKGTTESITSNELRKGRTKSAPRKGNSSTEGSLDVEVSPITYDDIYAAAFRNEWKAWTSDTNSAINLDGNAFSDGYFYTKCLSTPTGSFGARKLLDTDGTGTGDAKGLIAVPAGSVVHELTCGTKDIKYLFLKKFGGVDGEDLYQAFRNMAVNTISFNIAVNAIVTGSIGFMGSSDPEMLTADEIKTEFGGTAATQFLDGTTTGNTFITGLPEKSTSTDQFTAREGFLYVNGKQIQFANSLDMEVNNGLSKKFAIFVKSAIAVSPLSLDITGTLKTYLVEDGADTIFNSAVNDEDNEILFCIQDKETSPEYMYVFQIFKNKFTDHDAAINGADTLDVSFPYQSFEEMAVRMFRIVLPKAVNVATTTSGETYTGIAITPNVEVGSTDITTASVTATLDGVAVTMGTASIDSTTTSATYKDILYTFSAAIAKKATAQVLKIVVTWNGETLTKTFSIPASA